MKRLFLFLVIAVFFFIFLDAFAYYSFLSPKCNTFLEELKEKYRTKLMEPIDTLADIKVIEVRIEDLEERVDFSGSNWGNVYRIIYNPDEVGDDDGGRESEPAEGGEEITVKLIGIVENVIGWVTEWTVGSDTFYTVSPDYGSSMFILIGLSTTTMEPTSTNDLFL